jgi:hypothetical protein
MSYRPHWHLTVANAEEEEEDKEEEEEVLDGVAVDRGFEAQSDVELFFADILIVYSPCAGGLRLPADSE